MSHYSEKLPRFDAVKAGDSEPAPEGTNLLSLREEEVVGGAFSTGMSEASFGNILYYGEWLIG